MIEKYFILLLAGVVLILVIELIREEKLTFKYAFGWIFVSILAIIFTIFDALLFRVASFFGFELKSDFILFIFLAIFVFLSLLMTIFLCQQNSNNDVIAQQLGILKFEIEKLKEELKGRKK